jgi:cardiolipin synthase
LVDDRSLIMGSSNFEFFSHALYQEIVAIIHNPGIIAEFKQKVMIPDLEKSIPPERTVCPVRGYVRSLRFRLLANLSRKLTFLE